MKISASNDFCGFLFVHPGSRGEAGAGGTHGLLRKKALMYGFFSIISDGFRMVPYYPYTFFSLF